MYFRWQSRSATDPDGELGAREASPPIEDPVRVSGAEGADEKPEEEEDILMDFQDEDGIGDQYGLVEIPGGIGVDSCASDNVMAKKHLPGYTIKPSAGSRRGQRWGSASGHMIPNEGECTYAFMTEHGNISCGTTQVGEVRRPLAAVSKITKAKNIAFFDEDNDWILDKFGSKSPIENPHA